jgi:2-oxoglutarate ferredoxin oxidoreductase subunit alpha
MRVRAFPFTREVDEFVKNYDQVFVVEMNRDGQLHQLLSLAYPDQVSKFKSVAFGDGMPASAKWMREGILSQYAEPAKKAAVKKKASTGKTAKSGKKGAK